jgi:hypothetical protein
MWKKILYGLGIGLTSLIISLVAYGQFGNNSSQMQWFLSGTKLHAAVGTADGVCDNAGSNCTTFGVTSGATKALDNLAAVAINESLVSDTALTDDLGTEPIPWLKGWFGSSLSFEGSTDDAFQTTITFTDPTTPDKTITFPDLTGTVGLSTNKLDFFSATSSAELITVLSDETGSGLAVFGTSPAITTPTGIIASDIVIATGAGSPTVGQVQEYLDNTGSSGFFLGGALSDGGSGTLDVAAGSGFIRTTNDDNAELQSFKWSASSTIAVADDTTQYVYVDDAGAISLSTNEFLETPDLIQIGVVTDEGGTTSHTFSLGVRLEESIGQAGRFIRRVLGISRDKRFGGLIYGQSGDANRDVTITEGKLWWGRTEYAISAFDTSGADTFETYSTNGQENATASQWPNEQYDNAGTLTTLGNNKWANLFFYIEPDDHIVMIYGRVEHGSQGAADEEGVPTTSLPSKVSETSILAARFTFQKSSNTAIISSAFDQLFANASVTSHPVLANLAWTSALHTGTASNLAGFDGGGAASEYTLSGTGTVIPTTTSPIFTTPNIGTATGTASGNLVDVVDDSTPDLGGDLTGADKNITGLGSVSFTQELDGGSETGNFSVDFSTDQKQKTTLTANVITLTLDTTDIGVGNYLLKIVNGGLATLTWAGESGSVFFPAGTDPTLTASGTDIVTFYFDGTNFYGVATLDFQ